MSNQGTDLSEESAAGYFAATGVIDDAEAAAVSSLGGGVSNTVLRVETADACYVVKQPLPNLAVEDDWPADTNRIHNEAAAARAYGNIIANAALEDIAVPEVIFEDHGKHIIVIACAPDDTRMWKSALLEGVVDPDIGETLGRFLATSHNAAATQSSLREQFENKAPFEQLRLDPYHRTVADRHPDVRERIKAEVDRISDVERTLVHGDFSPKNVLVPLETTLPVWLLDFEVAHWGDPAFDTAFMINHLCIKAVFNTGYSDAYLETAERFWSAYDTNVSWDIETYTVTELAILMLARVDGKSPVEYVTTPYTKDVLRRLAKQALTTDVSTIESFFDLVANEVDK